MVSTSRNRNAPQTDTTQPCRNSHLHPIRESTTYDRDVVIGLGVQLAEADAERAGGVVETAVGLFVRAERESAGKYSLNATILVGCNIIKSKVGGGTDTKTYVLDVGKGHHLAGVKGVGEGRRDRVLGRSVTTARALP